MASKFSPLQSFVFLIIFASAAATALEDQTLDVQTLTGNTYLTMLQKIRRGLAKTYSKNVAVLGVFVKTNNPSMFDVVLKTEDHQISVKVRADNLYVVGYKMQTPSKWLEFGYEGKTLTHLIPGSEFLGFNETYTSLEKTARTTAKDMPFTRYDFINAVNELARTTDTTIRAKRLILMAYVISEATRFADISTLLARNLNAASSKLERYMVETLVKNWDAFSTMVLKTDADPCYKFVPPEVEEGKRDTVEQLRNRFGLMYRDPITLCPPCQPKPCTQGAAALNDDIPMIEMVAQA